MQAVRLINKSGSETVKGYLVEGEPFVEDLNGRYTSKLLEVRMKGGQLTQEEIFQQFRKYGKLKEIEMNEKDGIAKVLFNSQAQANAARYCLDGKSFPVPGQEGKTLKLDINYLPNNWKLPIDVLSSPRALVCARYTFIS